MQKIKFQSAESSRAPAEPLSSELPDFSLILGGPLFQLLRRAHLSGDAADLVSRRVIALALITWLPLLALSIAEGHAWGDTVKVPFLFDVDVHARFLLALPLLIVAELVVHQRMRLVVGTFVRRGLLPDEGRRKFDAAIAAAMRLRNSVLAEVLLIAFVYGLGVLFIWRRHTAMDVPTWYGMTVTGKLQPTLAGWWLGCVSLPLVQFILLRWYFRLLIWTRFLWQVSRIDLRLVAIHPDRAGGLGFLSTVTYAFAPLLAGQGVLLAGVMANKIFYAGAKLTGFKLELLAMVTMMLFFVLAPLLVFTPRLARTKRIGLAEYGGLAQRYVREFDQKWSTPQGHYSVGSKDRDHYSSEFGDYVNNEGNVVVSNIDARKDPRPRGTHFDPARMPYACTLMAGMRCTKVTFRRSPPHTVVFDCQREWRRASTTPLWRALRSL